MSRKKYRSTKPTAVLLHLEHDSRYETISVFPFGTVELEEEDGHQFVDSGFLELIENIPTIPEPWSIGESVKRRIKAERFLTGLAKEDSIFRGGILVRSRFQYIPYTKIDYFVECNLTSSPQMKRKKTEEYLKDLLLRFDSLIYLSGIPINSHYYSKYLLQNLPMYFGLEPTYIYSRDGHGKLIKVDDEFYPSNYRKGRFNCTRECLSYFTLPEDVEDE